MIRRLLEMLSSRRHPADTIVVIGRNPWGRHVRIGDRKYPVVHRGWRQWWERTR